MLQIAGIGCSRRLITGKQRNNDQSVTRRLLIERLGSCLPGRLAARVVGQQVRSASQPLAAYDIELTSAQLEDTAANERRPHVCCAGAGQARASSAAKCEIVKPVSL